MADGRVVIEAVLDTVNVTKNVRNLNQDLKGITWNDLSRGTDKAKALGESFKAAGTACMAKLTVPIAAAGAAAFGVASNYEQAASRIQSAFGVTREEAERFKDIGATIYEGGWGESLDDVTEALIQTKSTIRDIDDDGLQTITQNALVLADTFGADVNESIRGTNALMEGFGLSAQEASDLLAAGMQNGLNYTDELGDNLSEYSVRWGQAGVSASEYFSLLEAGASNGAYNLDKVGDFLNEFLTSLSDGRLEEHLGQLSDGTRGVFDEFKAGKATAKDVLDAVIGDMRGMTDETARAALAGELWSSLGEDNAMGMILTMGGVEDKYADVAGAADALATSAGDNFAAKMESAGRTIMGALEPMGEPLLNIATAIAGIVSAFGTWFASIGEGGQMAVMVIAGIAAAIGPVLSFVGTLVTVLPTLTTAFGAVKTAVTGLSGAFSFMSGPVGIVIAAVGALIGVLVYLWNTNEGFRNAVMVAWETICGAFQAAADFICPIVSQAFDNVMSVVTTVMDAISGYISSVWDVIQGIFNTVVGLIVGLVTGDFSQMQQGIGQIMGGIQGMITNVWNGISGFVGGIVNGMASTIGGVFNGILGTVTGVFGGIYNAISEKIGAAKDFIGNALSAITGFFAGLKFELPHINLPHFSLVGEFSLMPPSVPHLSVDWYAKGAIFNKASVVGVGEAGNEGVIPLSGSVMRPFARTIAEEMPDGAGSGGVVVNVSIHIDEFVNESRMDLGEIVEYVMSDIERRIERKKRSRGLAA